MPGPDRRPTALVTGPTSGIGESFARRLAADGHDLVLVSRDADRLAALAASLEARHGVTCEVLPADLSDRADVHRVAERLGDAGRPVDVLVNNAGFGVRGRFVGGDVDAELRQLDVLATAVLVLCHAAVPGMVERRRGVVVNVSSVAGFGPMGTYSAAKAWCTSFTEHLAASVRGTGVTVTALCPGFVRTEFHERAGMDVGSRSSGWWLDPDDLVEDCLADVRRGRVLSVPSRRYKALAGLLSALPPGGYRARVLTASRRRTGTSREETR
ncbi:SDR family NAD(P)-dependent oxidoreductase [Aquipuribacter nitratireducens]|uniref:SDR family NAD(P)-dependent oxidoreductase n=1 Tax=Aquipuribacter nitratireducens TaxID=650104 RepID=A0ABW0GTC0_9MICO